MTSNRIIAVAALLALGMSTPAFAQQFTLQGNEVPADQVDRIQQHCDALLGSAGETGGTAMSSETAASADAGASAETSGAASSETTTSASGTTTDSAAEATDGAIANGSAAAGGSVDFANLDLETVDIEACRAGGFLDAAGQASTSN